MELEKKDPTAEPVSLPLGFLRSITDDFCYDRMLGDGGYGVVYKGILPCGSVIAVKKFHETILASDNYRSFENEASFLMDIEHQNVVQLLGFCAESSGAKMMKLPNGKCIVAEQLTRMLCFEYMCKGGLDKHLSDESKGLEWNTRYKIIKGICHGLNFLHGCNIIHLDLKPDNILLDATMTPKIADFGLSRLLGKQKSNTVAVTSNRPGTRGYMAPEYIDRGIISTKADIFSLGVIIIEILKGCKDYPDYGQSTEVFQQFTEKVLSNWRNRFERSLKCTTLKLHTQLVKQCTDIALKCVHPDKEKRPNVSDIIEILNATEESCYDQNGKDLPVAHQMGTQEGLLTSGVQHKDGLVALAKIALKDHAQAWITKGMMKSAVALLQPQREPVLESVDGSLAALCYQGARNASFWVAHKALASLKDNVLHDWAATLNLGPSVEALERELLSVKAFLESTLGKVINNLALEDILMVLRELVYDAEDVLDEMEYFRIQGNMLDAGQHAEGFAHVLDLNVLPSGHDEAPNLRFDRDNASQRIEHIVEQMKLVRQEISSTIILLGSDWSTVPNIAQNRPITISESTEPKLFGRELIMKSIIDDITKGKHSREVLTVIPIVGPGGIGKTTLAQYIYQSGEVKEHFQVRVWTCVSLNFNVKKLTEEIERHIPRVDHESINGTASELIGQRLKNKRLLLVLDDIWDCSDEDEWKMLLMPFRKSQILGNIIIVTTRLPAQAHKMVQKNDHSIYLQGLDSEPFEKLFLEIIFGDDDQSRNDHKSLLEIGIMIAHRLKGSPLAAKTVGRLLKTQLDLVHWTRILESKEWEHSNGKNDIMPALKLSFDYLRPQLQQCFSYCALFPQDYRFEREELINFWIGQEALHYSSHGESKRVEDIGLSHLTELVNYGFLEDKGEEDGKTCYTIHDLLHELACKVSSLECLSIDTQSQVSSLQIPTSIRHLSINIDDTSVNNRQTLKNCMEDINTLHTRLKVEKLQTLMIFGKHHGCFVKAFGDLFREAKSLRLVFLSGASYDVKDLLHNFYCLIHLRYLHIGWSRLYEATFLDKISRFYHMKVLDAKGCDNIKDLPRDVSNLVKLRHLLVKDDKIHSSITEVGKLKSLQELRRFVVKKEDQGFELSQIGHLEELVSLRIDSLQNVQVPEEPDEAKLMQKRFLHELILHWENIGQPTNVSTLRDNVLESLKPRSNLQKLSIIGHRGGACPSWLGMNLSLSGLESLCLDDVAWKTFPPIGDLWLVNVPGGEISINRPVKRFINLRRLELVYLSGLKKWDVHAPCQLFPNLEVLIIRDCSQLVELSLSHSACCGQQGKDANGNLFSRLLKLKIARCRQLSSFPPLPWTEAPSSIKIREISSINHLIYRKEDHSLYIRGDEDTNDSTFWAFDKLTSLQELRMSQCGSLPLHYLQMLSSLKTLEMPCLSNSFPFVEADNHVQYRFLVECLIITEWNANMMELTRLLTYFPKLSDLRLLKCNKVTELAVNVKGQLAAETPGPSSSAHINKVGQQQGARVEECGLLLVPPQLQQLWITNCPELKLSLLRSNPHGRSGGGRGVYGLTSLQLLSIRDCPVLLSSSSFPLEHLTSLTSLTLSRCGYSGRDGFRLLSLLLQGHLTELVVRGMPYFFGDSDSEPPQVHEQEIASCSSRLQVLEIDDVAGFTAASIRRGLIFSSLTTLEIFCDNQLERFTEQQGALLFVDSLEKIWFYSCPNLKELPERLHGLRNFKKLWIMSCRAIRMLPKKCSHCPSSLEVLDIFDCPEMQSLPKDCLPDSLRKLEIKKCPAILSLPEVDDLPRSLRKLYVRSDENSRELRRQCCKLINIIPIVTA